MTARNVSCTLALVVSLSWAGPARVAAQTQPQAAPSNAAGAKPGDTYEVLYERYLQSARMTQATTADTGWMASLASDLRARRLNDLVTIRVVESISAAGTADSAVAKNGSGKVAVTNLFGAEDHYSKWMDPGALVGAGMNTDFKGGGATTRTGELTATVTARVVEVLPNGDLVLEGAREIDINGDRQIVVLTGVLRTADIMPGNHAYSTSIGQLRIRYFGRGLMKDSLKPGFLIRFLNKIF